MAEKTVKKSVKNSPQKGVENQLKNKRKQNANLRPVSSPEEAKKRGSAGGKKSAEIRQEIKCFKDALKELMEAKKTLKTGEEVNGYQEVMRAFKKNHLDKGEIEGIDVACKLLGEQSDTTNVNAVMTIISDELSPYAK